MDNIEDDLINNDEIPIYITPTINNIEQFNDYFNNPIIKIIIDYSNNIFKQIGLGFIENIYHKALLVDLYKTTYDIETKKILPIYYNHINLGYVETDIIIQTSDDYIILELKSFDKKITSKEEIQLRKYINHTNTNKNIFGIIINFNQNYNNIDKREIDYKIIY